MMDIANIRGGDEAATVDSPVAPAEVAQGDDEPSLDEKVYAAMNKLGMSAGCQGECLSCGQQSLCTI